MYGWEIVRHEERVELLLSVTNGRGERQFLSIQEWLRAEKEGR